MSPTNYKRQIFVIEGLNAFATGLYFNWIFFYTQKHLHFGVKENLGLVAVHGLIYSGAAWMGGWFGHRFGRFLALKLGFFIMAVTLFAGFFLSSAAGQVGTIVAWTFGMCFTWPILQSLITEGEKKATLPRLAGIYNLVWSAIAAISFFNGGTLVEKLGIGSIFLLPAAIHVGQLVWTFVLEKERTKIGEHLADHAVEPASIAVEEGPDKSSFLRLALLANPMAYVAINTAIPMIPEVAKKFQLGPMLAGIICSVWFFVRMGAFVLFWLWPGWHYRFRFLATAKFALVLSFLGVLLSSQLWLLIVSQIVFGLSVGLIYYSSLFYSMDGGASKSEHGGMHEAMIGVGTLMGASVGIAAKHFLPNVSDVSTWAVGGLLLLGFFGLLSLRPAKLQAKRITSSEMPVSREH